LPALHATVSLCCSNILLYSPLISILAHLHQSGCQLKHVHMLYSTKLPSNLCTPSEVLFLPRLLDIFESSVATDQVPRRNLQLFLTSTLDGSTLQSLDVPALFSEIASSSVSVSVGRITDADLLTVAGEGPKERGSSVYYVCGPPDMTDHVVQFLQSQKDVIADQVLCEKWW
jgi:NAD(P)H-flavin reductase